MPAHVYFTGLGLHTALGCGVQANLAALRLPIPKPELIAVEFAQKIESLPYRLLADEPRTDIESRFDRVVARTVEEAIAAAALTRRQVQDLTLFLGTSSGDIATHEARFAQALRRDPDAQPLADSRGIGNPAYSIAKRFGLRGADFTINTACTASANALLHAAAMMRSGRIERALVVGIELCNAVTALGFQGLQLLSSEVMRPFDARRRGLNLGEGCSAVILEREPKAAHAFDLRGGANLCDTYSVSAANPDGSTVRRVIERALAAAQLDAADIAAIKAHGTASLLNDEAEVAGMRGVFGALPPLFALKPRLGHTLGACGLNELVLSLVALSAGWLPGTPDVCATASDLGVVLNQTPRPIGAGHFMFNYFGFGGNNTSLVVSNRAAHEG